MNMLMRAGEDALQLCGPDVAVRQDEFVNGFFSQRRHGLVVTERPGAGRINANLATGATFVGNVPGELDQPVFHIHDQRVVIAIKKIRARFQRERWLRARQFDDVGKIRLHYRESLAVRVKTLLRLPSPSPVTTSNYDTIRKEAGR